MNLRHAPIAEALVEIRFVTTDRQPLAATAGQLLHQAVRGHFPKLEFVTDNQFNVQYQVDQGQVKTCVAPPGKRLLFKSVSGNRLLQLTDSAFTANILPPYEGWLPFRNMVEQAWVDAVAVLGLKLGARLTLRYVNKIVRDPLTQRVGAWLKESPFLGAAILPLSTDFHSAIQLRNEAQNLHTGVSVTTFPTPPGEDASLAPLLFDISVFVDLSFCLPTTGLGILLERLHDQAYAVFAASMTEAALRRWQ